MQCYLVCALVVYIRGRISLNDAQRWLPTASKTSPAGVVVGQQTKYYEAIQSLSPIHPNHNGRVCSRSRAGSTILQNIEQKIAGDASHFARNRAGKYVVSLNQGRNILTSSGSLQTHSSKEKCEACRRDGQDGRET